MDRRVILPEEVAQAYGQAVFDSREIRSLPRLAAAVHATMDWRLDSGAYQLDSCVPSLAVR